jgi:hypothetical protein
MVTMLLLYFIHYVYRDSILALVEAIPAERIFNMLISFHVR